MAAKLLGVATRTIYRHLDREQGKQDEDELQDREIIDQ
jgi:hypothetical protein